MQESDRRVLLRWRRREHHECGHCSDLRKWLRLSREGRNKVKRLTSTQLIGEPHCDDHSNWQVSPYINPEAVREDMSLTTCEVLA